MKLYIVTASQREESESFKVGEFLASISADKGFESTEVLDLGKQENSLMLNMSHYWNPEDEHAIRWAKISESLEQADAVVFVTPEWNGSLTANTVVFMNLVDKELAHKPGLLVSVSGGRGGAYPITQMRTIGYKNSRINYIPEHLIVRGVGDVMNGQEVMGESDQVVRDHGHYCLRLLAEYAKALKSVRDSGVVDHDNFAHGMS